MSNRSAPALVAKAHTHAPVFGQNDHGTTRGDAAFREFHEKLARWP